ncbi:hypothetical protein SRB5_12270 [Streptomyces sp. RB5]|uniref:Uncharacterized protein n=1 Tax=Streptomyces smaragdinus TaxID=2585196 RepID=A0A7K0CCN6_9ACTN|nr:SCO2524 family protein [Streptomyces smaragdinus]MQY11113.1 hypothetical protein [Streptomyces smaragdinus]
MRIQPRQQLLEIWEALAAHSFRNGKWNWGETGGLSSVADAERLLCLMYPATEVPAFRLDDPDTTDRDVLQALESVGGRREIPVRLIEALQSYTDNHTAKDGTPSFAGGYYFVPVETGEELTPDQRALGVVDSYSLAVTLCLATLGFLKVFTQKPRRPAVLAAAEKLKDATETRLTAALVCLLRSFTVNVFDTDSSRGRELGRLVSEGRGADRQVLQQLHRDLRPVRAVIEDRLSLGLEVEGGLDDEGQLFECGWGWSVIEGAPEVTVESGIGVQADGVAQATPYLYFTVNALDGLADLYSDRTLSLGLLNSEQQTLAEALRLRWEITQQYWSTLARFGEDRWPLEDIPWRATGQKQESPYFSLSVAAIVVQDLVRLRATDDDLTRTVAVMERLAERARITSRMAEDDPVLELHNPGVKLSLAGSDKLGPLMTWTAPDFSAQLLKRCIQLCTLSRNRDSHDRLLRLAERVLGHLWRRRRTDRAGARLWDDITGVFPQGTPLVPVSWSNTERMTECMVAGRNLYQQVPIRSTELAQLARALLSEAGHLYGNELLEPSSSEGGSRSAALKSVEGKLNRSTRLLDDQPGTAGALAMQALTELDNLASGRRAAVRGM